MIKRLLFPAIIFMSAGQVYASRGSGFEFLKTSFGARPAAMGGAFICGDGDLSSMSTNPAGVAGLQRNTAVFTYMNTFADFQTGNAAYGHVFRGQHILGISMAYMNYGSMDWTDAYTGEVTGSSAPGDFLIQAAYARRASHGFSYGVSAKYIRSQIQNYSADAVAMDAGLLYHIEKQQMNLGLSVTNLGKSTSAFIRVKENLPLACRAGLSKTLAHLPLTLHLQLLRYQYQESDMLLGMYWALGGEFKISERSFLRWGYDSIGQEQKVDSDKDRFTGISLGFGTMIRQIAIDYAVSFHGVLGSIHQFTVYMTL
ncbi:PorV/PorQ family protein [bacterium]|nr:PorV/PorQ family protein [bacterium]